MRLSSKSNTSSVIPPRWKFPASTRTRETRTRSQYWRLVPYQQSFVLGGTMHISPKNTQLQLKRNRTSWFGSFNTSMLPLPGTRLIRLSWCGIAVPWVFINASIAFSWVYCTVHAPGKWQKRLTHDHSSMRYSPWVLYLHTKRIVGEVHVEGQVSSMHYAQRGVELKRSLPSHNHAKGIGEFQLLCKDEILVNATLHHLSSRLKCSLWVSLAADPQKERLSADPAWSKSYHITSAKSNGGLSLVADKNGVSNFRRFKDPRFSYAWLATNSRTRRERFLACCRHPFDSQEGSLFRKHYEGWSAPLVQWMRWSPLVPDCGVCDRGNAGTHVPARHFSFNRSTSLNFVGNAHVWSEGSHTHKHQAVGFW